MGDNILLLVRFRIGGRLRFLSHAETLRVFQRACVRAGVRMQYTEGFNPHPKLSLPLPRAVGVESDDELLSLRAYAEDGAKVPEKVCASVKENLSAQLPQGCDIISVDIARAKTSFQPRMVSYVLPLQKDCISEGFNARIEQLLAAESLTLDRRTDEKGSTRKVDVRAFLVSIELGDNCIIVECKVTSAGTIRVDEILELMDINIDELAAPVRRRNVQWQETEYGRQNNSDS